MNYLTCGLILTRRINERTPAMNRIHKCAAFAAALAMLTGCTKIPAESVPSPALVYKSETAAVSIPEQPAETLPTALLTEASETTVSTSEVIDETDTETTVETTVTTAELDDGRIHVEEIVLSTYEVELFVGKSQMPYVTMLPYDAQDRSEIWTSGNAAVATVDAKGNITAVSEGSCTVTVTSASDPEIKAEVKVTVNKLPEAGETVVQNGLTYIDGILVVNKTYSLPSDYAPGVNQEALDAFNQMQYDIGVNEGLVIYISSDYRSYDYQDDLYNRYVKYNGQEYADTYSEKAGHSEHQTGLAFDLNTIKLSFGETSAGKWVAEHCHEYGFIIRYPEGKEASTGFGYEPWHIRYLGVEKATEVYESGLSLEEYLGITSEYAE